MAATSTNSNSSRVRALQSPVLVVPPAREHAEFCPMNAGPKTMLARQNTKAMDSMDSIFQRHPTVLHH